jgi:hypothetical protein
VPFDEAMLAWPAGRRDTDGVWARYWYAEVEKTTSFAPYRPKNEPLPDALGELAESCAPIYDELYQQRLTV